MRNLLVCLVMLVPSLVFGQTKTYEQGRREALAQQKNLLVFVGKPNHEKFEVENCVICYASTLTDYPSECVVLATVQENKLYWKQTFPADVKLTTLREKTSFGSFPEAVDALDEVNEARARRGLRPFIEDHLLTKAARSAAAYRAARRIEGHTPNDFAHLPAGANATAAGCAAWTPDWKWGACCTYESWTYAGAAWVMGQDGRRYMHLFVR